MRRYHFVQADVFTEVVFGGNPVAVFLEAEGLTDKEMQSIAREMNLSESAFVLPPTDPRADTRVRFFTPQTELPFAGHPTIGTHVVLAQMDHYEINGPVTRIWQQVGQRLLPVDLITDGSGQTLRAVMTQADARHGATFEDRAALADALGIRPNELAPDLPAQVYSTGLPGLIIPLVSLEALRRVRLNINAFNQICRDLSVTGASVFTTETVDKAHHAHTRHFAPMVGIYEDPATGSMGGALGAYMLAKDILPYEKASSTTYMVFEQGHQIERPSLIEVEVDIVDGAITEVRVGGQVVIVAEGDIILP
ncbi:MAG: PhzF family phenazine biosynthesis protein [Chloroflexi bacterium]|nr:PhzF family phenazine biosynthesis protein [Chloroflexota bacterium]